REVLRLHMRAQCRKESFPRNRQSRPVIREVVTAGERMVFAESSQLSVELDREDRPVGACGQLFGVSVFAVWATRIIREREEAEIRVTLNGGREHLKRLVTGSNLQACFAAAEQTTD